MVIIISPTSKVVENGGVEVLACFMSLHILCLCNKDATAEISKVYLMGLQR